MNENLKQMLKVSEGRHLQSGEIQVFKRYYEALPQRLEIMRRLEEIESDCVKQALDMLFPPAMVPEMRSELRTEVQQYTVYLYRAAATSLVQQDLLTLAKKVQFVFAILARLGFPSGKMESALRQLQTQVQQALTEKQGHLAAPYFQILSEPRLPLWAEFQTKAPELLQQAMVQLLTLLPHLKEQPAQLQQVEIGFEFLLTDLGLAMFAQSAEPILDAQGWLDGYFHALHVQPKHVKECCQFISELASEWLSAECAQALAPWLRSISQGQ